MVERATAESERRRRPADWPAILVVFALVVGFTYSDDLLELVLDATNAGFSGLRWMVLALDCVLIAGAALLKKRITSNDDTGERLPWGAFLRQLVRGWWAVGAVLVVAVHLVLILTAPSRAHLGEVASVWIQLLGSLLFVVAMSLVLMSVLDDDLTPLDHRRGVGRARRDWILPLAVGTFVVHVASALWYPVIDMNQGCANEIAPDFFSNMVQVLPLLLVTLGIEMNFLRRTAAMSHPGQRAAPVITVLLLCIAEGLAFSMLVKSEDVHCGFGAVWHEYIAFVVTVQATAISLATLVWLLLTNPSETTAE
jgi:hypothetical protein